MRVLVLVARALRTYRRAEGLTQEEAAGLIGCSVPTYRHLEQGVSRVGSVIDPRVSTVMRALTLLKLDEPVLQVLEDATYREREILDENVASAPRVRAARHGGER